MTGAASSRIARHRLNLLNDFVPPAAGLERALADIFGDAFRIDRVGANDEFFDLGGDSLTAEVIALEISRISGRPFLMSTLVEYSTPARIAKYLRTNSTPLGRRPPIFFIHGAEGFCFPKPSFLQGFHGDQQLIFFQLLDLREANKPPRRVEDIAAAYTEKLIEECPVGPFFLVSFCVGGVIALEIADQMAKLGRAPEITVVLDPGIPKYLSESFQVDQGRNPVPPDRRDPSGEVIIPAILSPRVILAKIRLQWRIARLRLRYRRSLFRGAQNDARLRIWPKILMLIALSSYRMKRVHPGRVLIVARNAEKQKAYEGEKGVWRQLFPNMRSTVIEGTHYEIGGPNISRVSEELQKLFDGSDNMAVAHLGAESLSRIPGN